MDTTSRREKLKQALQHIPDDLLGELDEYMKYLQYKKKKANSPGNTASMDTAYASETVLGKDWNRPEEDQAWQDL
jgi:DNA replication initiation complex subunit (GINS family)